MPRRYTGGFLSATEQATDANTANGIFTVQEAGALTTAGNFPTGRWTPQRSLRFRASAGAFLYRAISTDGSLTTGTISFWFKPGNIRGDSLQYAWQMYQTANAGNANWRSIISSTGSNYSQLGIYAYNSSGTEIINLVTVAQYRDYSAWYHCVVNFDTTQAVASERVRAYINGSRITNFSTATYPAQNAQLGFFKSGTDAGTKIGSNRGSAGSVGGTPYYDGYLAEYNAIDGQSLDPSYFGTTDPETGTWVPKRYTGTYGTNGFYLPFTNSSFLGYDQAPSTNLVRNSEAFGSWQLSGVTVGSNNQTDPNSGSTADTITANTSDALAYNFATTQPGTTYTFSVYLKAASATTISLLIDRNSTGSAGYETVTCNVTTSWQRFSVTTVAAGQTISLLIGGAASFSSPEAIYAWGAQVEVGNVATTYVPSITRNDWTTNNFSTTAGATYDWMVDVPGIPAVTSQQDIGGVQRGNYCTWNPAFFGADVTYTNANLTAFSSTNGIKNTYGTIAVDAGKWYFEETITAQSDAYRAYLGFAQPLNVPAGLYLNDVPGFAATWNVGNTSVTYGTQSVLKSSATGGFEFSTAVSDTKSVNDVYMYAYDGTTGKIWFGKNGTWFNSGSPSTGANPAGTLNTQFSYTPACNLNVTGAGNSVTLNCGQRPFAYTPPTGFKSICTTNLPNSVIKRPSDHFDVKTWTGNGTALTVGTTAQQTSAYRISKSLRLQSNNAAFLNRTPASASNRKTWTWSAWVKKCNLSQNATLFAARTGAGATYLTFVLTSAGDFRMESNSETAYPLYKTNALFRDPFAWYHIVVALDTTQALALNRLKVWVNGVLQSTASYNVPAQNTDLALNSTETHLIGQQAGGNYADAYIAEYNLIDGQALTPSSFGVFDANNNWMPQRYTGTYGTNGFYLPFSDDRNTTTLGYDTSGNSNNWTPNNIAPPVPNSAPNVLYYGTPGTYSWTAPAGVTSVNYITVAGGGGGGGQGGGGAGGMLTGTLSVTPGTSYTVTVGRGGATGVSGSNSVFSSITSTGGGYGATAASTAGANGGSGGGGSRDRQSNGVTNWNLGAGTGTAGQGNNGGAVNAVNPPSSSNQAVGGGGGGAGAVGGTGALDGLSGGNGGNGLTSSITGTSVYYAGGGGAYGAAPASGPTGAGGTAGLGGGGAGGAAGATGTNAINGLGGGGGNNASGGSGVVILSYTNAGSYIGNGAESSVFNGAPFDTPTDYDDGTSAIRGNYAIGDNNEVAGGGSWTNSGLTANIVNATNYSRLYSSLSMNTGKWYWEILLTSNAAALFGIASEKRAATNAGTTGYYSTEFTYYGTGQSYNNGTLNSYGATFAVGDIIGVAFNADNGQLTFYKNNTSQGVAFTAPTGRPYWAIFGTASGTSIAEVNFGQNGFTYAPPAGFKALNTKNLKDVGAYNLPDTWGNFVNTPDMVWLKSRSGAFDHQIADTVRGPRRGLKPNTTALDAAEANGVQSFAPNGFSVAGAQDFNASGSTYVGWAWNRGKTPGFDIVNYGGTGAVQNVPHNLGQQPGFMMIKAIGGGAAQHWRIWHKGISTANYFLSLPDTGYGTADANIFPNPPSNSTFTVGSGNSAGGSSYSYIAYLWAEVPGFSKIGTYTGNSSADGPFVYCGFKPRFILARQLTTGYGWIIIDTERSKNNPASVWVNPDGTTVEGAPASEFYDILSNGFKLRYSGAFNTTGASHAYVAFAENPFKYATAR